MCKCYKKGMFVYCLRAIGLLSFSVLLVSCAVIPKNQPIIDSMIVSSQYESALGVLEGNSNAYGKNNQLLYLLDKGYIQHLTGNYKASIDTFEEAKRKSDELYTKSISKIAATWVVNDYAAPYHGEDFEHILINLFQSLNYALLGNYEDALVEARDVDSKLNAINSQYDNEQKNVYKEDAFVRLLMGMFYEASGTKDDLNDAFISYRKAVEVYNKDYADNYNLLAPKLLKENLLTTARYMGLTDYGKYKLKYPGAKLVNLSVKQKQGEIYLIQYNGISPVKEEVSLPVPMPQGHIIKVAFPRYRRRAYGVTSSRFLANGQDGKVVFTDSELGEDIGAIAVKNLDRRKLRFIAKSVARATGRYLVEKKQEESIQSKFGDVTAGLFRLLSGMYNVVVEQADLRCWQTLPDQIRIARLLVAPGEYDFSIENFSKSGAHLGELRLGKSSIEAGQKKFFIVHTAR
ncbi:MAG: hypothetical protein GY853_07860 [PVC group bacterium]|nr:hypothetical protein [PVC group bacterium]